MYTNGISNVEEQYIYLSTPSENPFTVRIMDGGCENLLAEIIISNDNPGRYTIGSRESIMVTALANKIAVPLQGMGVCLQAPEPFYANLRMQNSAQSGSLTAKGRIGTGTTFRTGKILEYELAINKNRSRSSFIGVLALEDDTRIRIADLPPELVITNSRRGEEFLTTLNKGESYILGVDMSMPNVTVESANAFMGALVESTNGKPIAVSCGGILSAPVANDGQDMGLDQPVPVEWIGNEYIAVRGNGGAVQERPIVIAHYNSTKVYVNGSNTPLVTLNEGEYFPIPTAYYESRGNMFIETDKPSYVYQMLSSTGRDVNLSLNFLPPINCFQPREVNNIADVNKIGNTQFTGGIILVTTSDAILEVEDDNGPVVLPAPTPVPGRVIFSTYRINNLVGDVKVVSDGAIQVGIFGQSGARGWAGYYAGFPTDVPFLTVVNDDPRDPNGRCYNGVTLKVIGTNYDKYFWYKDNEFLLEETSGSIFTGPYGAGEYSVKGLIENCGETLLSTSIPVEDCPDPL
ncbi:MAG: IgGFc-binding protein, partial [Bacteroidota bacterium]